MLVGPTSDINSKEASCRMGSVKDLARIMSIITSETFGPCLRVTLDGKNYAV
jgi:hypothetical protein